MAPPAIRLILSPDITPYKKSRAPKTIKKGMKNFFMNVSAANLTKNTKRVNHATKQIEYPTWTSRN